MAGGQAAVYRRRRLLVGALVLALLGAGIWALASLGGGQDRAAPIRQRCTATIDGAGWSFSPAQTEYAALIAAVSVQRGLPPRAASIATATAIQESSLRNLDYGDEAGPDSRGLFQQRPSSGWGTPEQVMDPYYAANAFYNALVKVPGYTELPITVAAQEVQRSAYPDAYADHESEGRAFASALTGQSPAALSCVLGPAAAVGNPDAVLDSATAAYGPVTAEVFGSVLLVEAEGAFGWSVAQWAVANAAALSIESVSFDGQQWRRGTGTWEAADASATEVAIAVAGVAAPEPGQ